MSNNNTPNTETDATIKKVLSGPPADGGITLGSATTDKVSLYGVTPIVQRTSANQAAVETTVAVSTTSAIWGFSTSTQANALVTLTNELRAALVALGAIKGS
jgi:hypothetical protein